MVDVSKIETQKPPRGDKKKRDIGGRKDAKDRKKIGRHGVKAGKFLMEPRVKIRETVPR